MVVLCRPRRGGKGRTYLGQGQMILKERAAARRGALGARVSSAPLPSWGEEPPSPLTAHLHWSSFPPSSQPNDVTDSEAWNPRVDWPLHLICTGSSIGCNWGWGEPRVFLGLPFFQSPNLGGVGPTAEVRLRGDLHSQLGWWQGAGPGPGHWGHALVPTWYELIVIHKSSGWEEVSPLPLHWTRGQLESLGVTKDNCIQRGFLSVLGASVSAWDRSQRLSALVSSPSWSVELPS